MYSIADCITLYSENVPKSVSYMCKIKTTSTCIVLSLISLAHVLFGLLYAGVNMTLKGTPAKVQIDKLQSKKGKLRVKTNALEVGKAPH